MVRLSLVNMYLHGFVEPHIFEYDTLTTDTRWQETFDVIMANPPFMSPKGGIRPHSRFSIQAKRSEVLFVDYITEHLNPSGRAAVIVPEGIIFQSQNAYKQLRKMLVENCLWAVVSLPAGVFNPYSGVKTSILFLDKSLAKRIDKILFVKIENDGFDLGAQRRSIDKNDLPAALKFLNIYKTKIENYKSKIVDADFAHAVLKSEISKSGDYNLSVDRYRIFEHHKGQWPIVELRKAIELVRGVIYSKNDEVFDGGHKIMRANNISLNGDIVFDDIKQISKSVSLKDTQKLRANDIFICLASGSKDHIGKVAYIKNDTEFYFGGFMGVIRSNSEIANSLYIYYSLRSQKFNDYLRQAISGANINNLNGNILGNYQIPLPPLDVQEKIVAEIDGYQKISDAARQIVENYKPTIKINPAWPMVSLEKVFKLSSGRGLTQKERVEGPYKVYGGNGITGNHNEYFLENPTLIIGRVGEYCGAVHNTEPKSWVTDNALYVTAYLIDINQNYLVYVLQQTDINQYAKVGGQPSISQSTVASIKVPLPPIDDQKQIVSQIETEQKIVNANKKLIEIFEKKISETISHLWGKV